MKNLLSACCLAAGLVAAAPTAHAQTAVSFGARLGLNVSNFSYKYGDIPVGLSSEANYITGVQVGGTANISFGKLALQPSVLFSRKGSQLKFSGSDSSNPPYTTTVTYTATPKLAYLEVPLNLVYTSEGDHGLQLFAGPYVAFGVGGTGSSRLAITSTDPNLVNIGAANSFPIGLTIEYGDRQNPNDQLNNGFGGGFNSTPNVIATFRRFDAGLNAGVGYRLGAYQLQAGYGLGLINISPNDPDGNDTGGEIYNRSFQVSANYFFGGK
ncbi:outer membrane beta-barrel protein [Hymenobacter arizonensis]|uniref:Outer membrane protein beta-barrel domain-containing protein n=1 Tax=Hymenobacter arizonensis TaxID=1227077 RepID=A0A1I5Y194_HYMAR|nr:outer membrane beta-barrel protein [Hymenobacter arizonensis]SFQ37914.1 Outer membrane protein beta-barrel domain-containing protein [Hymenobacter arizonensis]